MWYSKMVWKSAIPRLYPWFFGFILLHICQRSTLPFFMKIGDSYHLWKNFCSKSWYFYEYYFHLLWKNQHINAPNFTNNASITKSLGVLESLEHIAFVCCVCRVTTQILGCSISRNVTQHKRSQMSGSLASNHS